MTLPLNTLEVAALLYFLAVWASYAYYAKWRAKTSHKSSLSRSLCEHRRLWARRFLLRDMPMTDAALLANQERVVGFFASTTLIILAAILTAMANSHRIAEITSHIPLSELQTTRQVEAKLALLLIMQIYAFFKVTWSLRQYGFAAVLMGSAPEHHERHDPAVREQVAASIAKLIDSAGHDNNSCLRAYYFGLAVVCWLYGTVFFVAATTITVFVLSRREFKSAAVMKIDQALVPLGPFAEATEKIESRH